MSETLLPGFADPVTDAQACFRAVLAAMSRPGSVHAVPRVSAPTPLHEATASVLLALVDHETPLSLDRASDAARSWIVFHTGTAIVPASSASFALALSLPPLDDLPSGTDEAPETAMTVILQVADLDRGQRFVLEGPGLREPHALFADELPADFAAIWQRNHALFPRGIDLILCAGSQLAALPRSVTIREG